MKKIVILTLAMLWSIPVAWAQRLQPFGLEGKTVTALASYGGALYAGTDRGGVYTRYLAWSDSNWVSLGLEGVKIRSIYPHQVGPIGFAIIVGAEPNRQQGDSTLVYYSSGNQIWVPADSGIDRKEVFGIHALNGFPTPAICGKTFAGGSGKIYRRKTGAWEKVFDLGLTTNVIRVALGPDVWSGGETGYFAPWIAKSTDGGTTWEVMYPDVGGDNLVLSLAIHPLHPDTVYVGIRGAVLRTVDGGKTWNFTTLRDDSVTFHALAIDSGNPEHIYAGGVRSTNIFALYESFDSGQRWQAIPEVWMDFPPKGISSLVADPEQSGVVYIATLGDGLWQYRSIVQPDPLGFYPLAIGNRWEYARVSEYSPDTLRYTVTVIGDTVLFGQRYWVLKGGYLHQQPYFVRVDSVTSKVYKLLQGDSTEYRLYTLNAKVGDVTDTTYLGYERCVYLEEATLFGKRVLVKGFRSDVIFGYATIELAWGFGLSYCDYTGHGPNSYTRLIGATIDGVNYGSLTSVDYHPLSEIPNRPALYQNYPNPFNSSTLIRYQLPVPAHVSLKIYNLLGQEVRTLVDRAQEAGYHEIRWDGKNQKGKEMSSGVYFCKMQTTAAGDNFIKTVKLLILR